MALRATYLGRVAIGSLQCGLPFHGFPFMMSPPGNHTKIPQKATQPPVPGNC